MTIRPATEHDFDAIWNIFRAVVASADTYVFAPDTGRDDAYAYWFGPGVRSWVAEIGGEVVGMYKLVANQRDLGNHVANASFMISPHAHGHGLGKALGRHCLIEAKRAGFAAMQFNFVIASNEAAVALWRKLGFNIVGTIPQAFRHERLGLVDALVMHRFLDDIEA
ncbi:GNAT family N-acetyltransferase [Jeongeupia naejangsanensis]|uniref:GNAT family N-acetyltransferase n=1 Tax=Jeongeupia naejangsanensis TaxID=613195 RepID=A0ABS2BKQ5_9NEIS|nr:GNAT family N-acetyltransferase [Jeongeupia naejangsanensis]MBM3116193.1 GNAT family N-acetyltransferase [Jeongeupia naejangsanensis]